MPPPPTEDLLDELQEAAERDLGDFFIFRVVVRRPIKGVPLAAYASPSRLSLSANPPRG